MAAVNVSANFAFLAQEFPHAAEGATLAERSIHGDPRASCFHARHTLEQLVKRVYKVDKRLKPPPVQNLDGYMTGEVFRQIIPEAVWQKAEYVRKAGNAAVHGIRPLSRRRRWKSCASCTTCSTGPVEPTCARGPRSWKE